MREKILAKLKAKYSGLPSQILGLVADKLAATVTEESAIEGAVGELDKLPISLTDYGMLLQQEGDRRVTDAKKEWEKNPPKPSTPPTHQPPKTETPPTEMPEWFKPFAQTVQALTVEKQQSSIKNRLAERLKDKVPERYYSKFSLPEKEEDIETFAASVEQDWTEIRQSEINQQLTGITPPGSGGAPASQIEADITAWAKGAS